jgi:branched-chain amino acid transport system ATP-binding protein
VIASDQILRVEGLTKEFGGLVAVDDLSFEVFEGEILGLIGPNGSGKTTVFNCLMSTYTPTSGRILFQAEDITDERTYIIVRKGVSRVSQHSDPIDIYTVRDNIRLFTLPNSVLAFNGGASDTDIRQIADRVGIVDHLDENPGSLPHASVRKLEIAKAIATDPDLLLLDEPFAGLNQAEIQNVSELIRQLQEQGTTILIIDHNMRGLMALVERVLVLYNGTELASGSPTEIAETESVQEAYLAGSRGT